MEIVGITLKEWYMKAGTQDQNAKCKIKSTNVCFQHYMTCIF